MCKEDLVLGQRMDLRDVSELTEHVSETTVNHHTCVNLKLTRLLWGIIFIWIFLSFMEIPHGDSIQ